MENTLVKLYNELGNKIVSMIPGQWEKIYYLGEVEGGRKSCSSVFYFIEQNAEEINRSHDIPTKYQVSDKIYRQFLSKCYFCYFCSAIFDYSKDSRIFQVFFLVSVSSDAYFAFAARTFS
mgnify:CR=1 FL=1